MKRTVQGQIIPGNPANAQPQSLFTSWTTSRGGSSQTVQIKPTTSKSSFLTVLVSSSRWVCSITLPWENFIIEITLLVALCIWVEDLFAFFPLVPSITVQSEEAIKGPEECWHCIHLGCVEVTAEENRTLEGIGVVTAGSDPCHLERLRLKATSARLQRAWRQNSLGYISSRVGTSSAHLVKGGKHMGPPV